MTDARMPREAGRESFGLDPAAYERARPAYPSAVYDRLVAHSRLAHGAQVLEVGAGTGLATFELLRRGAAAIVALEPDARLAQHLRGQARRIGAPIEVVESAFEDYAAAPGAFDVVAAATAFHWVDEARGLALARAALRPGGTIALWWNVFGDPQRPDPFHEATRERLAFARRSPSAGTRPGVAHALDAEARSRALSDGSFVDLHHELFRWSAEFTPDRLRDLCATFSEFAQLATDQRVELLDYVEAMAAGRFGGRVARPMLTALYVARKA